MKKLIALLLVLCMVLSLAACGKPADDTTGTGESQSANAGNSDNKKPGGDMGGGIIGDGYTGDTLANVGSEGLAGAIENIPTTNDDLINPDFKGKTIQIYGYSGAEFDYIDDMGKGSYIWMVRAAIDEWAALNDVTIVFEGDYDQNAILGAINSGEKPDVILGGNRFPLMANMGIIRALTDEEYKQISGTCGTLYTDMMMHKGECYGFNQPWSGNSLFYYNKTMFEEYGVKTPKEYYLEGNWNWETYIECMKAVTKDLDGDGKFDTYGTGTNYLSWVTFEEAEDGSLSHLILSDTYKEAYEISYQGAQDGWKGAYADCTIATSPRPMTHMGDSEWYNFEHLNQTLVNGDVIETIFPPTKDGTTNDFQLQYTPAYISIFSSCDENEAVLAMLTYILRVGMRYMSEFSCGLYGCDYEGIRGVTAYSLGWRENFQEIVEQRLADFDALEDWDQEAYDKLYKDILAVDGYIAHYYPGWEDLQNNKDTAGLPPASALPILAAKYDAFCTNYNNLYLN